VPRIVSGAARGRTLAVPAKGTRPTSDRAREALFNTLGGLVELPGARVLDLFAGSGAVGLEALSRGAAHVSFIESDRAAVAVLEANLGVVGITAAQQADVRRLPVENYLGAGPPAAAFDFVFADPPYAVTDAEIIRLLRMLAGPQWLAEEAVVVVERSARGDALGWPEPLESVKHKRYGEGMLWYGRYLGRPRITE
jgi:16S rRNA (guanine966-N2)-methyltransferase